MSVCLFEGFKPEFWNGGLGGHFCKFVYLSVQGLLLFVKIIINQLLPLLFVYTNPIHVLHDLLLILVRYGLPSSSSV